MNGVHTFQRPQLPPDARRVGEVYSPEHRSYDEGVRYVYRHGAHDLTLFWRSPTPAEIAGLRDRPVEVGLFNRPPAAFLLYRIDGVCEWSDVAFNVHLLPADQRELPAEPPGERARLILTLVDATDGVIRARRLLALDRVTTQALRHAMTEQSSAPFVRTLYEVAVQEAHARYPDGDALADAAEVVEATIG